MSKAGDSNSTGKHNADEVLEELESVCEAPALASSPKLQQMLRYLVGQALEGRTDNLKAYTIAVDGMGRNANFCADTDPYVRNLAVRLRRSLTDHYANGNNGSGLQILLRRGTYVPEFREQAPGDMSVTFHGDARLPTGGGHTMPQRVPGAPGLMVHVLDESQSGAGKSGIGAALSEEIVVEMSRFPNVRLYGPLDPNETGVSNEGGNGGVQYALRGRVRVEGKEILVTLRLLDARTNECLWAQIFHWPTDKRESSRFEEMFVRRVAVTLADWDGLIPALDTLGGARKNSDGTLTPYEAALKAHAWGATLTDAAYLEALRQLEACVEANPDSGVAHAVLSDLYFSDYLSGIGYVEDGLEKAEALARKAVALDPASAEAHWALGQACFAHGDTDGFESEFSTAISLNPNDISITASYGLYLAGLGQMDRAMDKFRTAKELSGQAPPWAYMVPWLSHYQSGNYDAALTAADSIATPGLLWGALAHAACFGMTGDKNEARMAADEILRMQHHFLEEGSALLGHLIRSERLRDLILEGLQRAGLDLKTSSMAGNVA